MIKFHSDRRAISSAVALVLVKPSEPHENVLHSPAIGRYNNPMEHLNRQPQSAQANAGAGRRPSGASLKREPAANDGGPQRRRAFEGIAFRELRKQMTSASQFRAITTFISTPPITLLPVQVNPDVLLENRAAWVEFYLYNLSGAELTNVFVRATIQPIHSLNSYPGLYQVNVAHLANDDVIFSAISFILPRADLGNTVTLELCRIGDASPGTEFPPIDVIASAELKFDVGARFSISMNEINIKSIASHQSDTVYAALSGYSANASWSDSSFFGDHGTTDSRHGILSTLQAIGPFNVVPEDNQFFSASTVIANCGHTSREDDEEKALLAISAVAGVVATTVASIVFPVATGVWAALSAAVTALNDAIIEWAFKDCDTVVLADAITASTQDLLLYTLDPNDQKETAYPLAWRLSSYKKGGDILPGITWLGGGCEDSNYTTSLALFRHRHPGSPFDHSNDGTVISPGETVSLANPLFEFISSSDAPTTTYELEGDGLSNGFGDYTAPATTSFRKFAVLKIIYYTQDKEGIRPDESDFAIVLLD